MTGIRVIGESAHYGVVVDSPGDIDRAIETFTAAEYSVGVETTDPDGQRGERYVVLEETQERDASPACC